MAKDIPESEKKVEVPNLPVVNVHISLLKVRGCVVELRKSFMDRGLIEQIVSAAYHRKPILILPHIGDPLRSWGSLIQAGLVEEKEGSYYWTSKVTQEKNGG